MRTLLHPARTTPALHDAALLIARAAIGFILMAHGLQKFLQYTLDGTAASFTQMGIPVPAAAAAFVRPRPCSALIDPCSAATAA